MTRGEENAGHVDVWHSVSGRDWTQATTEAEWGARHSATRKLNCPSAVNPQYRKVASISMSPQGTHSLEVFDHTVGQR